MPVEVQRQSSDDYMHQTDIEMMEMVLILQEESSSSQVQSQKVYLQQKFPAEKLYKVSQTYTATDLMDLSLNAGDLVGIVQDKDPMGNKDRWFVDNGGEGLSQKCYKLSKQLMLQYFV